MTDLLMIVICILFAVIILYGINIKKNKDQIFSLSETLCIKGIWCIVIIFVHIPIQYGNKIQNLIGSFAYIGVTFFFLISAYGLKYSQKSKKEYLITFWKNRLPKLLIPAIVINSISIFIKNRFLNYENLNLFSVVKDINRWVICLIILYFIYYVVNLFIKSKNNLTKDIIISIVIIIMSLITYFSNIKLLYSWPVESIGFIYGLILFDVIEFLNKYKENIRIINILITTIICIICGIVYLKYKHVYFVGEYILRILLSFSLSILIIQIMCKVKIGNAITEFLGKISYEVYLFQYVSFSILNIFKIDYSSESYIILAILMTVFGAYIVNIIDRRIINCFYRKKIKYNERTSN